MMINAIHHFEILTKNNKILLNYFLNGLNFKLISVNKSKKSTQHIIKSKNAKFIISSLNNNNDQTNKSINNFIDDYDTIDYLGRANNSLLQNILSKNDSVFNIALQVKSIDYILSNCLKYNVEVIKKKSKISDNNGFIYYAIINSCVDGVVHTLIEKDNYIKENLFLPNIQLNKNELDDNDDDNQLVTTHFDHLTYATYKNTSNLIINWYTNIFNMRRFYITK
jgi:hypothetical protein